MSLDEEKKQYHKMIRWKKIFFYIAIAIVLMMIGMTAATF